MVHIISFPGFGIGPFTINQIAVNLLGRNIAWYGIIITFAMLCAILYAFWRGVKFNGIKLDDMVDLAIFSIPAAMIGARLYFVLFNLADYNSFYSVIAVWNGGLAVYGGIILGLITGMIACRIKKISVLRVFDSVAPAIMLGQIIGRWGNFFNAEAYGGITDLIWKMRIENPETGNIIEVHPTFLYESLWNLVGFIFINIFYKKRKFEGQVFLFYGAWYGFGRMFIEGLRTDSLYIGNLRVSQLFAALCFIVCTVLLIYFQINNKNKKTDTFEYENQFKHIMTEPAEPKAAMGKIDYDSKNEDSENPEQK